MAKENLLQGSTTPYSIGRVTQFFEFLESISDFSTGGNKVSETVTKSLMNIHDTAQYLAVSVATLYDWVWQRRILFVEMGRAVRFELSDLRKFVEDITIKAGGESKDLRITITRRYMRSNLTSKVFAVGI